MKCHYEILNIPRDAEEAEIKTSYKKLALKWHPDKNLDNPDEAKEQFQLVQQAYEILSDRQERAWYDNHREQILRGSNKDYEDNSLDVFQYFTTTCFKGYSDSDNSFYTVYRNVFEQIAKEDMEYMEEKEEFCDIPVFGTSKSDYEATVGPFYSYWSSYSTRKSYVWLDPYNIKETRERRIVKLIEKENKKVRAKAKKERNEEIRNLVAFVRKRDKRVHAQTKKIEEKAKEQKLKHEEISKQKKIEKRKEHESSKQTDWMKFDNVKSELEEIEKKLAEEFGEEFSNSEEDQESYDEMENLYCVACNKVFKTPKAFENHESSKKHKDNVEKLKETMLQDEDNLDSYGEGDIIDEDLLSDHASIEDIYTDDELLEISETEEQIRLPTPTKGKKKKKKKNKLINIVKSDDEVAEDQITSQGTSPQEETTDSYTSRKQRRKSKGKNKSKVVDETEVTEENMNLEDINDNTDVGEEINKETVKKVKKINKSKEKNDETDDSMEELDEEVTTKTKKSITKKTKKLVKVKVLDYDDIDLIDKDHCCVCCQANFNSKNKLFDHLKKTGHSVHIPTKQENIKPKKKSVKDR